MGMALWMGTIRVYNKNSSFQVMDLKDSLCYHIQYFYFYVIYDLNYTQIKYMSFWGPLAFS